MSPYQEHSHRSIVTAVQTQKVIICNKWVRATLKKKKMAVLGLFS